MQMDFDNAMDALIEAIKADYLDYTLRTQRNDGRERDAEGLCQINRDMIADFNDNITYKVGKKYAKIIKGDGGQRCVWGFVVATDDDKVFPKGTILKAAGWAAPARNHSRGNIMDGNGYTIQWTGPLYM